MSANISIRDSARLLGVHENTIRNWIDNGGLAAEVMPGPSSYRRVSASAVRSRIRAEVWREAADHMEQLCEVMRAERERVRKQPNSRDWPGSYLADRENHAQWLRDRADEETR